MIPGPAASMQLGDDLRLVQTVLRQRAAQRGAQLVDRGARSDRPLVERVEELSRVVGGEAEERPSRGPQRSKIDRRIPRLPALQEALDRRMEDDAGELVESEDPVSTHRLVRRGD